MKNTMVFNLKTNRYPQQFYKLMFSFSFYAWDILVSNWIHSFNLCSKNMILICFQVVSESFMHKGITFRVANIQQSQRSLRSLALMYYSLCM